MQIPINDFIIFIEVSRGSSLLPSSYWKPLQGSSCKYKALGQITPRIALVPSPRASGSPRWPLLDCLLMMFICIPDGPLTLEQP
jgi:hypothetical protein